MVWKPSACWMAPSDGSFPVAAITRTCIATRVTTHSDGSGTGVGTGSVGPRGIEGMLGGSTGAGGMDSSTMTIGGRGGSGGGGSGSRPRARPALVVPTCAGPVELSMGPRPHPARSDATARMKQDRVDMDGSECDEGDRLTGLDLH